MTTNSKPPSGYGDQCLLEVFWLHAKEELEKPEQYFSNYLNFTSLYAPMVKVAKKLIINKL
jgi:hypothetical protein